MTQLFRGRNALVLGVGLAAVGIAVGLIVASQVGSGGGGATSTAAARASGGGGTTAAVKASGATETAALLDGIPQQGNVLGRPGAPVTMVEFADLQCPFCAKFSIDVLPTIVRDYVRTGKVKLVFNGLHFLGEDSEIAVRTAYAAALQKKLWHVVDLLFKNQGGENTGWVSEDLLQSVAASVPGLDGAKMLGARGSADVDQAIFVASGQAEQAGVDSTPTFFAGKSGETLQPVRLRALEVAPFREALDGLLK
jgi:protein-disulfide isomerase